MSDVAFRTAPPIGQLLGLLVGLVVVLDLDLENEMQRLGNSIGHISGNSQSSVTLFGVLSTQWFV